jgi:hypothetical protein
MGFCLVVENEMVSKMVSELFCPSSLESHVSCEQDTLFATFRVWVWVWVAEKKNYWTLLDFVFSLIIDRRGSTIVTFSPNIIYTLYVSNKHF